MNKSEYRDYLKSDHWQNLRLRKLKRTTGCFICHKPESPEIHHIRYKNLTDVNQHDLKRLCASCHELFHAFKNEHPNDKFEWTIRRVRQHNKQIGRLLQREQRKANRNQSASS